LLRRDFEDIMRLCGCRNIDDVRQISLRLPSGLAAPTLKPRRGI
jgi:isopentenyl diphosphate isomerase/L-lactate dehydrogenase-like FMN-dependent dehydrogenase